MNWLKRDKMATFKDHGGLNFRDLEGFNLSMLGKQGLKLLTNTSSLITRFFKAKYFPISGFLDANIGHSSSFTWMSICSTIPLLSFGYRWKISGNNNINVWNDPLIRSRYNMCPTLLPLNNLLNMKVSQLFDTTTNTWNQELIASIMNAQGTSNICKIPLHSRVDHDVVIWKASPNGSTLSNRIMSYA